MSGLFMKFSFIHPFRFRGDNARVFQQISMYLNMMVGQAACRLLCRYRLLKACWLRLAFAELYELLRVNQPKELVAVHV